MSSGYKGDLTNILKNTVCTFETNISETLKDSSLNYNIENTYTNTRTTFPYLLNNTISTIALYHAITVGQSYDDSAGKCPPKYIFSYIDFNNVLQTAKGNWAIYTTPNRFLIRNICLRGGSGTNNDIPKNVVLIGRNSDVSDWYLIANVSNDMSTTGFEYTDSVNHRKQIVQKVQSTIDGSLVYAYKQTCAIFTELAKGGILTLSLLDYDAALYL